MAEDGVRIRPGREDDVPALLAIYNHYVLHSNATFDMTPLTLEQRLEWFSHYAPDGRHRLLVAERAADGEGDSEVLGYATSSVFRPRAAYDRTVETSIYLRDGTTGTGLGTRLYRALFDAIADEDIHRLYAVIAVPNEASVALHRAFGFVEVGRLHEVGRKFDRWWDVIFMEKRVEDSPLRGS
ncbi:MAG: N-acetyltransferase family protein [Chloroflexota bacterium]